ncbi:MAG: hypothetical protein ABSH50_01665 [Bryobacteraceae bacterium]|jgi:hypothetical protein
MGQPASLLRRTLPFLSLAAAAAIAYDGWIFYSRWRNARDAERAAYEEEIRRDRETIDRLGGTSFRILNFYAVPQTIRRGRPTQLCFGVYAAKHVRIDPGVGDLHPAINHCLEVAPHLDTQYKLTADDGAGHTVTQTVQVNVVR